jgi:hypothetical protein
VTELPADHRSGCPIAMWMNMPPDWATRDRPESRSSGTRSAARWPTAEAARTAKHHRWQQDQSNHGEQLDWHVHEAPPLDRSTTRPRHGWPTHYSSSRHDDVLDLAGPPARATAATPSDAVIKQLADSHHRPPLLTIDRRTRTTPTVRRDAPRLQRSMTKNALSIQTRGWPEQVSKSWAS